VNMAQAARWPQISVSSTYSPVAYPDQFIPNNNDWLANWTAQLNISVPIYTGGNISGNVEQARGQLEQAEGRLEQARETAAFDARRRRVLTVVISTDVIFLIPIVFTNGSAFRTMITKFRTTFRLLGRASIVSVLLLLGVASCKKAPPPPPAAAVQVGTEGYAVAQQGTIESGPTISGTLVPRDQAVVRAQISGSVLKVYVDQGRSGRAGDALATIDNSAL